MKTLLDENRLVGEKGRIGIFFENENNVSAVLSLAKPHRIKASHRRRWNRTTGHSVYIMNNPLSATDPTGYAVECPKGMTCSTSDDGKTITASATKNGITATQKLDGSTGKIISTSVSNSNGAVYQTPGAMSFNKMSNRDKAQINSIISSSSDTYKDVDGKTQKVEIGTSKNGTFTAATGNAITNETNKAAAVRGAGLMQALVDDALASGDQKYIDGLKSVKAYVDLNFVGSTTVAMAIQGPITASSPTIKLLALNPSIGRAFNNDLEVLFAGFHEVGHLYSSQANWTQIRNDAATAKAKFRDPLGTDASEMAASVFANTRMRKYASDQEIRKYISKDLYYGRDHTQDARVLGGVQ
jgi:hypothetical protein